MSPSIMPPTTVPATKGAIISLSPWMPSLAAGGSAVASISSFAVTDRLPIAPPGKVDPEPTRLQPGFDIDAAAWL